MCVGCMYLFVCLFVCLCVCVLVCACMFLCVCVCMCVCGGECLCCACESFVCACIRVYVCVCVCGMEERATLRAHTRTHNRPDCTESAHSMQSRPYIRVRAQPHRSQASLFFFLHLPPRARENGRAIMYVCVCGMEERTTLRARAHTHNPPSLGSVLMLDSSPSFARTRERKSEGHRAHIRVHSQSGPDKFSLPWYKLHGTLHKTDSGSHARAYCIERAS